MKNINEKKEFNIQGIQCDGYEISHSFFPVEIYRAEQESALFVVY